MVEKMRQVKIPGVEVFVEPVKEHRFVVVFRGDGLGDKVNDTDPQAVGVAPLKAEGARRAVARRPPAIANEFVAQVGQHPEGRRADERLHASRLRPLPEDRHDAGGLRPARSAAIAVYPMYKGLARLVGMDILDAGDTLESQVATLKKRVGPVRLLLPALQVHRQHRRGRQLRQEGRDDREARRGDSRDAEPEAGRVHRDRRPQHAEQVEVALVAPGADADPGGDWPGRTA